MPQVTLRRSSETARNARGLPMMSCYGASEFASLYKEEQLKIIPELRDLSYESRLLQCGLTTLETRRLRGGQNRSFLK